MCNSIRPAKLSERDLHIRLKRCQLKGRPLKGWNAQGCSVVISRRLHFRVFCGINQFQNQFSRIWNWFAPEGSGFFEYFALKTSVKAGFHLSETGLYQKVLENQAERNGSGTSWDVPTLERATQSWPGRGKSFFRPADILQIKELLMNFDHGLKKKRGKAKIWFSSSFCHLESCWHFAVCHCFFFCCLDTNYQMSKVCMTNW